MQLEIVGTNHFDTYGRRKLRKWLRTCSSKDSPPAFVAVEYDVSIFAQIKLMRGKFRALVQECHPQLTVTALNILECSLVYEGDAHQDIFKNVETVWLDKNRPDITPDQIKTYAIDRLNVYEERFRCKGLLGHRLNDFNEISRDISRKIDAATPSQDSRDNKFALRIIEASKIANIDWAIAIVGWAHTRKAPGTMVEILRKAGIVCNVCSLDKLAHNC